MIDFDVGTDTPADNDDLSELEDTGINEALNDLEPTSSMEASRELGPEDLTEELETRAKKADSGSR